MSYANPIDTRIVQVVLDDLEDNNQHTLAELLARLTVSLGEVSRRALLRTLTRPRRVC